MGGDCIVGEEEEENEGGGRVPSRQGIRINNHLPSDSPPLIDEALLESRQEECFVIGTIWVVANTELSARRAE